MSDERTFAEVVRADQIKVGDRIVSGRHIETIEKIDDSTPGTLWIDYENCMIDIINRDNLITRLLPTPVEVRDLWRVKYKYPEGHEAQEEYRSHEDATAMKAWVHSKIDGVQIEIIPLRAVILRREDGES